MSSSYRTAISMHADPRYFSHGWNVLCVHFGAPCTCAQHTHTYIQCFGGLFVEWSAFCINCILLSSIAAIDAPQGCLELRGRVEDGSAAKLPRGASPLRHCSLAACHLLLSLSFVVAWSLDAVNPS